MVKFQKKMTNLALYYKKLTQKNNICSSMKKLIETLQSG